MPNVPGLLSAPIRSVAAGMPPWFPLCLDWAALTAAGLELTIGGEPTFTARTGQAAPEWQGAALGPDKWRRGRALAALLRDDADIAHTLVHDEAGPYACAHQRKQTDQADDDPPAGTQAASPDAAQAPIFWKS